MDAKSVGFGFRSGAALYTFITHPEVFGLKWKTSVIFSTSDVIIPVTRTSHQYEQAKKGEINA